MKAESNLRPENKFDIENIVDGKCDIVFYNNIEELEPVEGETRYFYDIYRLTTNYREDLEEILNEDSEKYDKWLELSKQKEFDELAKKIRTQRDKLLADTDWTQMSDTALSSEKQEAYRIYRQLLRDITEQAGFPYDVKFPTLESEV